MVTESRVYRRVHAGFRRSRVRPTYFSRIVLQRSKFRELMGNKWPFLSADDHTTLEKSLGYEGDAHASIFPD